MGNLQFFDSIQEMTDALSKAEKRANALTEDWQKAITYGDRFAILEPSIRLWAFCHVLPEEELWEGYAPDSELFEVQRMERDSYSRGYRVCRVFSVIEPEGTVESVHILKALALLDIEEWELAKSIGWSPSTSDSKAARVAAFVEGLRMRASTPGAIKFV